MTDPAYLRQKRASAQYVKLRFLQKIESGNVYLFVEGADGAYYRSHVGRYTNRTVRVIDCKGKKHVLESVQRVVKSSIGLPDVTVMFFVDRDYDEFITDQEDYPVEVFVTEFHSVENYLVTQESLAALLEDFVVTKTSKQVDLDEFTHKFDRALRQYYQYILPAVCWVICRLRSGNPVNQDCLAVNRPFTHTELTFKAKKWTRPNADDSTDASSKCDDAELQQVHAELLTRDPKVYIRGKAEAAFMISFVYSAVEHINAKFSVSIAMPSLSNADFVRVLGPRTQATPPALKKYIETRLASGHAVVPDNRIEANSGEATEQLT